MTHGTVCPAYSDFSTVNVTERSEMANTTTASPQPFSSQIQINREKVLGVGNSVTYQGTYQGQFKVAVKRFELERSLTNEFTLHEKIKHDNVLILIAVEHDDDFR